MTVCFVVAASRCPVPAFRPCRSCRFYRFGLFLRPKEDSDSVRAGAAFFGAIPSRTCLLYTSDAA
ncbi:MAG: hypothetical protein QUS35_07845, partial [bacterium]|nr:hypothetical protein [bacterium]